MEKWDDSSPEKVVDPEFSSSQKVTPNKKNIHKPWKSLAINSYRLVSEFHHYFSRGLSSSKRKWQRLPGITFESKNLLNLCGTIF